MSALPKVDAYAFQPSLAVDAPDPNAYVLPDELRSLGIEYEVWRVKEAATLNGFNLQFGFKLNDPTDAFVKELLADDEGQEKRVFDFRTPEGSIDVVEFSPQTPGIEEWLKKFDAPHTHSTPEYRVILAGAGYFNIYTKDGNRHTIPVAKGSFVSVPANITHNFNLAPGGSVMALRVFLDKTGWVNLPPKVKVVQE